MRWDPEVEDERRISLRLALSIAAYVLFVLLGLLAYPLVRDTLMPDRGGMPRSYVPMKALTRDEVIVRDVGRLPRRARPLQSPQHWVTADDYPVGSLRDGRAGTVAMRFTISEEGRATHCTIVHSSGSPLLDATACGLVEERARYFPARDAHGRAVPMEKTLRFTWKIPD